MTHLDDPQLICDGSEISVEESEHTFQTFFDKKVAGVNKNDRCAGFMEEDYSNSTIVQLYFLPTASCSCAFVCEGDVTSPALMTQDL